MASKVEKFSRTRAKPKENIKRQNWLQKLVEKAKKVFR